MLAGRRLSFEDGLALYRTHDLLGLGQLANHVREKRHGDAAYFVWNTHINHTNVCVATCDFCAFAAKKDEPRAYTMAVDEVVKSVSSLPKPVREVHVVGRPAPRPALRLLHGHAAGASSRCGPTSTSRPSPRSRSSSSIASTARASSRCSRSCKEAGLDSMPGGGAEIFANETRSRIIKGKADAAQWLDVMRSAHRLGIPSNATMLYGHVESLEDRVDHLLRLRELQDETGGFVTFIPLAFQPWEAPAMKLPETTGFDDLKAIAVARLMLDNVPHVKSYWIMITPRLAQVGLSFGADDIDGTVTEEKIAHDAGAQTPQVMTVHELVRLVREAGPTPGGARHGLQRGQGVVSATAAPRESGTAPAGPGTRVVRLGAVSYLNSEPHVHGLDRDPGFRLEREVPSRVARRLHAGEVDLGLVPSIEYAFGDYAIVPGVAVGSRGPVRSVCLFHHGPLERVRRVALDTSSRTSAALVKILLRERLGRDPQYVPMGPALVDMLAVADAALLIGDRALDQEGEVARLDLGEAWTQLTGLPFVFAFWAGRAGAVSAAGVRRLQSALAAGREALPEIAGRYAAGDASRAAKYESYLRENIVYRLGEDEQAGLREFYRRAHALSLIPAVPELRFHAEA